MYDRSVPSLTLKNFIGFVLTHTISTQRRPLSRHQSGLIVVSVALSVFLVDCTITVAQPVDPLDLHLSNQIPKPRVLFSNTLGEVEPSSAPSTASLGDVVFEDAKYVLTSPLRITGRNALILGSAAAGIGGLMVVDKDIRMAFQRNRSRTKDTVADGLAIAGSSYVFLAGHLGLIASGFWFREHSDGDTLLRVASISLEGQLFAEAATGFIKVAAGRRRPNKERGSHSYTPFQDLSVDRSFPSGHATRAFTVAAVFADHYPQPVPFLAYSTASLIGLSRILLDEHFSSDVLAGAVLGFSIGKVLSWHHRNPKRSWMVLPLNPDVGKGVGLSFHCHF